MVRRPPALTSVIFAGIAVGLRSQVQQVFFGIVDAGVDLEHPQHGVKDVIMRKMNVAQLPHGRDIGAIEILAEPQDCRDVCLRVRRHEVGQAMQVDSRLAKRFAMVRFEENSDEIGRNTGICLPVRPEGLVRRSPSSCSNAAPAWH